MMREGTTEEIFRERFPPEVFSVGNTRAEGGKFSLEVKSLA